MLRWVTVARGDRLDRMHETLPGRELPHGTELRFKMKLNRAVALAFDGPVEWLFRRLIPPGVTLKDVRGEVINGQHYGIVDAVVETNPLPAAVAAMLPFIAKWVTITVLFLLVWLVIGVEFDALLAFVKDIVFMTWVLVGVVTIVLIFVLAKAGVRGPGGVRIGK